MLLTRKIAILEKVAGWNAHPLQVSNLAQRARRAEEKGKTSKASRLRRKANENYPELLKKTAAKCRDQ